MTPREGVAWLSSALFLLQVPGSLSLSCPSKVTGTVGGSLTVQCHYEAECTENKKYWCEGRCLPGKKNIVETAGPEQEVRSGRVSIRDHPANLTFTVTLESLRESDNGTHRCGIKTRRHDDFGDPLAFVVVSVFPAPTAPEAPGLEISTSTLDPRSSLPVATGHGPLLGGGAQLGRTLLPSAAIKLLPLLGGSVHFLLLVFVELPLLLSMLSAVL